MTFYNSFISLCALHGKKPSQVARDLTISKSTISNWKTRGTEPTDMIKQKIADYFHVSVDDLLVGKEKTAPSEGDGLSDKDLRLIEWFRSLPPEKQKAILISQDAPEGLA